MDGHFEGRAENVEELLNYCRKGPRKAHVKKLTVKDAQLTHKKDFTIKIASAYSTDL